MRSSNPFATKVVVALEDRVNAESNEKLGDLASRGPSESPVLQEHRARMKRECLSGPMAERDNVNFVPERRETAGHFLDVHGPAGASRHSLVGSDVKKVQTASSSKKNGPVRTRPKSITSSFINCDATVNGACAQRPISGFVET